MRETMINTKQVAKLRTLATAIRRRDLQMVYETKLGHIASDFSATDILTTLYFNVLRVDPHRPDDPNRDRFILSKGHGVGALYITLAHAGFFPLDELATFTKPLSRLNGHPNRTKVPGVETD